MSREETHLGTEASNPHFALAKQYLDLVLPGDRRKASQLITDAVEQGTSIRDVYLDVLQPVQREIGRLWQLNRISVAQEHVCTAITQLVMSLLYPKLFSGERREHSMVGTCIGGELHEIGVRMVVDLFEMDGWDTYYLGADMPHDDVIAQMVEVKADLLAISVTMPAHVDEAAELIGKVRDDSACNSAKVMVGGLPFNLSPELWSQIKADGTAADAESAVATAARLVGAS